MSAAHTQGLTFGDLVLIAEHLGIPHAKKSRNIAELEGRAIRWLTQKASFVRRHRHEMSQQDLHDYLWPVAEVTNFFPAKSQEIIHAAFTPDPADRPDILPPDVDPALDRDMASLAETDLLIGEMQWSPKVFKGDAITHVLNRATPAARGTWQAVEDLYDTVKKTGTVGRPFTRATPEQFAAHAQTTKKDLDDLHGARQSAAVQSGLLRKMGTDADRVDNSPPTLREAISASVDAHEGTTQSPEVSSNDSGHTSTHLEERYGT